MKNGIKGSRFRVSPLIVLSLDFSQKRFYEFKGVGAAHFVILSGEKRRMLKKMAYLKCEN